MSNYKYLAFIVVAVFGLPLALSATSITLPGASPVALASASASAAPVDLDAPSASLDLGSAVIDTTGSVRGRVLEQATGRPLVGARVRVLPASADPEAAAEEGRGQTGPSVLTDADGRFVLTELPVGIVTLRVEALGFEPLERPDIRITPGRAASVTLELRDAAFELEGLEVRVSSLARRDDAPLSTRRLTADEVRRTAGAQTDISRTLLSLPGVLGAVDNRNDLLVRGGGPGETAYYLDGIRIPRINHFETQGVGGGALGLLNVEFIEDTDFYAGAFPARYGNALSSALVIRNRRGSSDRFRGDVTVGASEAGVTLDGPLGGSGTLLASVRRSYLQLLFELIDLPIRPSYWDAQLRAQWDVSDRDQLTVTALGAIDNLGLAPPDDGDLEGTEVVNRVLDNDQWGYSTGVTWRRLVDRGVVQLALSRSMDRFQFGGTAVDTGEPLLSNDATEAESRLSVNADLRATPRITLGVGAELVRESIQTDLLDRGGPGRPVEEPLRFENSLGWWSGAAWVQGSGSVWQSDATSGRELVASLGLRADAHEELAGTASLSPRGSLTLAVSPAWDVSLAGGRFLQSPPRAALAVEVEGERVNRGMPLVEARHLTAGVAWTPSSVLKLSLEAFYKPYRNLPRSASDPRVVLQNEGGDFGFVGVEPLVGDAEGRSRGLELFVQRQGSGRGYALASYTLSWSEARSPAAAMTGTGAGSGAAGGGAGSEVDSSEGPAPWIPTSWDARHALDLTAGLRLGTNDEWELGSRWRVVSGRPFTPFDVEASPEAFRRTGQGVPDLDRLNSLRTPAYHRLDVRVDRRLSVLGLSGRVYLDIQNLYNRTNLFGFRWTEDPSVPDNLRPREQIGLLPTVGLTLEW